MKISDTNQKIIDDFKNNRKFIEFELDDSQSDDRSIVFYFYLKDGELTEKLNNELVPTLLENRFIDFANKEVHTNKRRVAPFDMVTELYMRFSVPNSQETFQTVLENIKNFIEEN